jgi:hypothetical protein
MKYNFALSGAIIDLKGLEGLPVPMEICIENVAVKMV